MSKKAACIMIVVTALIINCNLSSIFPLQFDEYTSKERNSNHNNSILINAGKYTFTVTDTIDRFDNQFPDISTGLHYKPDNTGRTFDVCFSSRNDVVVLYDSVFTKQDSLIGTTNNVKKDTIRYNIDDHFAGRTFSVWREGKTLRAEYILNGSGLPVVWSEKGNLTTK